ncbi:MAG: DinB family protein [Pyrinomonadaceae bacterium]
MKHLEISRPEDSEYAPYYSGYVSMVAGDDIITALAGQKIETKRLLLTIPEDKGSYRYAEGKWSIKELIGHVIDTERIMAYRALRIARNDATPLSGFDQDPYIENASFDDRDLSDLAEELELIRNANILMLKGFSSDAWSRTGTASENPVSVRALAYIIAGHELHHLKILKERYLN